MNEKKQLEDLLRQSGAELVRRRKHLVYRLPNGKNVVVASTPGDRRAVLNTIRDLKRAAEMKTSRREKHMETIIATTPTVDSTAAPETAAPEPAAKRTNAWQEKLNAAVKMERERAALLMQQAERCENRARMLEALLPYAEDSGAEEALRALFPTLAPPPPQQQPKQAGLSTSASFFPTAESVGAICKNIRTNFTTVEVAQQGYGHAPSAGERNRVTDCFIRLKEKGLIQSTGRRRGKAVLHNWTGGSGAGYLPGDDDR